MDCNSRWLLMHSTAPAQPTALDTSPSAAGKSPMRERCCATSGVVSRPSAVIPSSCGQTAKRAFWKYRCFRSSLLSDERNLSDNTMIEI